MSEQALQRIESEAMDVAVARQGLNIQSIADRILSGDLTNEKLDMIERLVKMDAERKFAAAFVALQADMPKVKATQAIPNNDGSVRSRFAPYEEIMEQVAPYLKKHGFTVSYSTDYKEGRLIKTITLTHVGGHSRSNQFAVRIGSGPPKASEAQADGAASTYCKRFALCDALNIVIDVDTDARIEGGTITPQQADELERRVAETNSNKAAFLKLAGAATYAEIPAAKYDLLDEMLAKKEARG
jgi:hypothetical protein